MKKQIRVRAICFWPFGGVRQCLWAREFCIAQRQSTAAIASVTDVGECTWRHCFFLFLFIRKIEGFSALSRKPPKRFEGFDHVLNVRSYLFCNSQFAFDRPCLFIDAASLCRFEVVPGTDAFECVLKHREETEWILRDWYDKC